MTFTERVPGIHYPEDGVTRCACGCRRWSSEGQGVCRDCGAAYRPFHLIIDLTDQPEGTSDERHLVAADH